MSGFQSFFKFFASFCLLVKLVTSSIRVNQFRYGNLTAMIIHCQDNVRVSQYER